MSKSFCVVGDVIILSFDDLDTASDLYAAQVVDRILKAAVAAQASDVHLTEGNQVHTVLFRVHGKLMRLPDIPAGSTTSISGRIKALARLITYRHDIPQEGRLVFALDGNSAESSRNGRMEVRVSTLPTLHGERLVLRFAAAQAEPWLPADLGLPGDVHRRLTDALGRPSGVILISGTAGSGKTTTAYAALRQLLSQTELRSVVTLEDPIECEISGAAQSQIQPDSEYDWSSGLKAILRQDPEVIFVGEIRDSQTAAVTFQAAMTGQLVISTLHARSVVDALQRLLDMGVPYQHLRSGLTCLVCQRLLPELCDCRHTTPAQLPCPACGGSGRSGRCLLAEVLPAMDGELAKCLAEGSDSSSLQAAAVSLNMTTLATQTKQAVDQGRVSAEDAANAL